METAKMFTLEGISQKARAGRITTMKTHIPTPAFMPIATGGYFRSLPVELVEQSGARLGLCNALHLMMLPGTKQIVKMGGIKNMMQWDGAILTDSGGYQVMSLASMGKVTEEGMSVKSPRDGSVHMLSPETSIQTQCMIGSDIIMVLDVCSPHPEKHPIAKEAMEQSLRWTERCWRTFEQCHLPKQQIFAIVHGGMALDLRQESLNALYKMDFDFHGFALGGLCVGEPLKSTHHVIASMLPHLPEQKPRYIMGMGQPWDLVKAVLEGADLFDCVLPTRNGRHGHLYTWRGVLNVTQAKYRGERAYPDDDVECHPPMWKASLGFLHHLFKCSDPLGGMLASWWNVCFYQQLMAKLRQEILADRIKLYAESLLEQWRS